MGKVGVFSFNGNKIITTSGGGVLLSDDADLLAKARFWATQARDPAPHYQHSEIGYNYRMSNILAAVGRAQLEALDHRVEARRKVFETYQTALGHIEGIAFMPEASFGRANRWLTVMLIDPKTGVAPSDIMSVLEEENIESRPVWKPMHLQPVFEKYPYFSYTENESVSDKLFAEGICLPSGSNLTERDLDRIISIVQSTLEKRRHK